MKDLELSDIFQKPSEITTRISLYEDGVWSFTQLDPINNVKTFQNQTFFKINQVFGLLRDYVSDPSKVSVTGEPGEYVGVSPTGRLYKLTIQEFLSIFPILTPIEENRNYNSTRLRDPNFITKIVKGSNPTFSNTTMTMPSRAPTTSPNYYNPQTASTSCGCHN
jgi:hypothetical protein